MARGILAVTLLVLALSPAFAHRGGGGGGGRGGGRHGPPGFPANVTGNLTGLVGAALANCSGDNAGSLGRFLMGIFVDDSSGSAAYSLFYSAELRYNGTAPDSLAVVQGAACDAAATAVLPLPAANWTTATHNDRQGNTVSKIFISGLVNGADATVIEAILAAVPNATVNSTGAAAAQSFTGRFPGRKLLAAFSGGSATSKAETKTVVAKGKARAASLKAKAKAAVARLQATTTSDAAAATGGYAVLATDSASGLTWGAALTSAGVGGGRHGGGFGGPDGPRGGPRGGGRGGGKGMGPHGGNGQN